ncbi:MAG: asparaginase [Actinomycetota bacterium]
MSAVAPLIVEVERSGLVESTHPVDVAVTDADGSLVAWAGKPGTIAYLRSSAKPIQALACLENGWEPPGVDQLAVACGSHNGEPEHVAAARVTLAAAGVPEAELRCPPAWPFRQEDAAAAGHAAPIFHNCSGKHAAMLATAVASGWPLDDYRSAGHPMQRAVASTLGRLAGRAPSHAGIDGCGVQTFALPLTGSARLFSRLGSSAPAVLDAMAARPFFVAGTGRLCSAIMRAVPGVVIKIGAEGLACITLRERGLGVALKSRDGTQRARDVAVLAVLAALEALPDPPPDELAPHATPAVVGGGAGVGSVTVRGNLHRA